jgi:hypothetical protein
MPAVSVDDPYYTARMVNGVGSGWARQMPEGAVTVTMGRMAAVGEGHPGLATPVPFEYLAYEIGWADRQSAFLSESQRRGLYDEMISHLSDSSSEPLDLSDAYAASRAAEMLGAAPLALPSKAVEALAAGVHGLCGDSKTRTQRDDMNVLMAATLPKLDLECDEATLDDVWHQSLSTIVRSSASDALSGDSQALVLLMLLEETRERYWPSDDTKRADLVAEFERLNRATEGLSLSAAVSALPTLAKIGVELDRKMSTSESQVSFLASMAMRGGDSTTEKLVGSALGYVVGDARLLGITMTEPNGFVNRLKPDEKLSMAVFSRTVAAPGQDPLALQVSEAGGEGGLALVSRYVLLAGSNGCRSKAFNWLVRIVGELGGKASSRYTLASQAVMYRALEGCGRSIPPTARSALLGAARSQSSLSVEGMWERASVECALDPTSVVLGPAVWSNLAGKAAHDGGVSGSTGYVDLVDTHRLIELLRSDGNGCISVGLLGG